MKLLYLSFLILIIDQTSKIFIKGISIPQFGININGMELFSSVEIINGFLNFTFIENPGMAFGIDIGAKFLFSLFTLLAVVGILFYFVKSRNKNLIYRIGLAFILGGAMGNMIDRIFYGKIYGYAPLMFGKVVDFIDVSIFNYHWFIFNVADSAVSIGIAILLLYGFKKEKIIIPKNETKV